ncbi:FkbM family methyltransferase [Synechococcus sp. UW140]|uniref:FkbM family methyltransferase n=1 Tax=Synechococcus sp. UW140 TaxID=368503 RepID=UPI003138449C
MFLIRIISNLINRINPQFHLNLIKRGYSGLNGLDKKLIEMINPLPDMHGYFIELGANDGLNQSNTYKLQKDFGWSGLLIEPSSLQFAKCVKNRSFGNIPAIKCAACVPFGYVDKFVEMEEANLMSVAKGLNVSDHDAISHADIGKQFLADSRLRFQYGAIARTLTSLLDEAKAPNCIDLLSLDVEGNELAVLQGLDFYRYKPKWILVEVRTLEIEAYLNNFGYRKYCLLAENESYSDVLFRNST